MTTNGPSRQDGITSARAVGAGLLLAFFLSGAASLIHEVVWTRLLRLVMGNTTLAIATVLSVFMAGLALGSFLGGRWIGRREDPLRVYAALEVAIGLYALALPWLIAGTEPIYRAIFQSLQPSFFVLSLIQFLFCGVLLLVPATLMGATLPVLARFFVRTPDRIGWSVGMLYAVNTFGAVAGVASTGFLLIPTLGVSRTIWFASLLNLVAAAVGYGLHRSTRSLPPISAEESASPDAAGTAPTGPSYGNAALNALLLGYALSGFAALVYEIAWTRVLTLMIGSSVYAFSMMLTAFILGLAAGSFAFARHVDRIRDPMRALTSYRVCKESTLTVYLRQQAGPPAQQQAGLPAQQQAGQAELAQQQPQQQ